MNKIIYATLLLLFFWVYIGCQPNSIPEPSPISNAPPTTLAIVDTSCPIGYVALDIEATEGFVVEPVLYELLDAIVLEARKQIQYKSTYTKSEALSILATIHAIVEQYKQSSVSDNSSFSISLRYKTFDADIRSLLYLTIAESLKLPIYGILMPKHMIVSWKMPKQKIYWETTKGKEMSIDYYISTYKLTEYQATKDKDLGKLGRKRLFNLIFFNLGKTYANAHQYNKAIDLLEQVRTEEINWFLPYTILGQLYRRMGNSKKALSYCQKSLELFPKQMQLYKEIGLAYADLGCNTESSKAYQQYLKRLSPKNKQYYIIKKDMQARINALN